MALLFCFVMKFSFYFVLTLGGCGGGILILNTPVLFKVNGLLSANGQDGSSRGGGGAGGSIHIMTSEFDGIGDIEVCIIYVILGLL